MPTAMIKKASSYDVKDIGKYDIHCTFSVDGANTEHNKTKLHVEDKVGKEEKVGFVNNIFGGCKIIVGGGESRVNEVGCFQRVGDIETKELSQLVG